MIRLAGFRRLHPVVPDRTALGAAAKRKAKADQAEDQYQSPEHVQLPTAHHTASSRAFSSRRAQLFPSAKCPLDYLADARVVRLGRTMSFGRVTLSSASDNKPVAMVSSAFAMLA